jgi:hypothetical protein
VRAGRLFDSKGGQMLTKQVVLLMGERLQRWILENVLDKVSLHPAAHAGARGSCIDLPA